jgi:hypothetical protein
VGLASLGCETRDRPSFRFALVEWKGIIDSR